MRPAALLVHVPDWEVGLSWYQKAFPDAVVVEFPEFKFRALQLDDFVIEIVRSDKKVSSGKAGTVLYWVVEDLFEAIEHFKKLGSVIYRGPMHIEHGLGICQVTDPLEI